MSKLLLAIVLCFASTFAFAAKPKVLWDAGFDHAKRTYTLRPHGKAGTPTSFEDTKAAIDKNVEPGEWVINNLHFAPGAQHVELEKRAKQRGATVVQWNEVVGGTIVEAYKGTSQFRNTDGYIASMRVDVTNWSPYSLRVTKLFFGSCGPAASVTLAKPLVIGPDTTERVRVTITPKDYLPQPDARTASCIDQGGWSREVQVEFEH